MKKFLLLISFSTLLFSSCKKEEKAEFLVTNPILKDTVVVKEYVSQMQSI